MRADDGHLVFYRQATPAEVRAGVLLSHGYSEHSGRYLEVIAALHAAGFAVIAPDHRGHGRTAQVLGDLSSVSQVLADLHALRNRLDTLLGTKPLFFFGHSMGALLILRYLQTYPPGAGAILNGAALKVPASIPAVARTAARLLADYAPRVAVQGFFDPTRACRDPQVWRQMRADPLRYKGKIRARTGREVMDAIEAAHADLSAISLPLLITHGSEDPTVPARVSETLFGAVASPDKTLHLFEGLRHEVQHEPEQQAVLDLWLQWLLARVPAPVPSSTPR